MRVSHELHIRAEAADLFSPRSRDNGKQIVKVFHSPAESEIQSDEAGVLRDSTDPGFVRKFHGMSSINVRPPRSVLVVFPGGVAEPFSIRRADGKCLQPVARG